MDLVFGSLRKEILIKEVGFKIDNTEREFSSIEPVLTKDNSKIF